MSEQKQAGSFSGKDQPAQKTTAAHAKLPKRKSPRQCAVKPGNFELGVEPLPKR